MTSQQPRIGIIIGSTREGRFGEKPAHWIHEIAKRRTDLAFELIDLRDHPLPFFDEPMSPAWAPVKNEAALRWADKLAALDGLIVVTPEYNHGPSAVLKNVVSQATDVKQIVTLVATGEADAGFVYVTDARTVAGKVKTIGIRWSAQPRVTYAVAVTRASRHKAAARAWVKRLLGRPAQAKLRAAGFLPVR